MITHRFHLAGEEWELAVDPATHTGELHHLAPIVRVKSAGYARTGIAQRVRITELLTTAALEAHRGPPRGWLVDVLTSAPVDFPALAERWRAAWRKRA